MSKYSHFDMCEKIFGSRYKYDERTHDYVPYSRTDMWDKLVELQQENKELKTDKSLMEIKINTLQNDFNFMKKHDEIVMIKYVEAGKDNEKLRKRINELEQTINTIQQNIRTGSLEDYNEKIELEQEIKELKENLSQAIRFKTEHIERFAVVQYLWRKGKPYKIVNCYDCYKNENYETVYCYYGVTSTNFKLIGVYDTLEEASNKFNELNKLKKGNKKNE